MNLASLKMDFYRIEKTKGAIDNGQSGDTDNIGHHTQNEDKQHKNKIKKMSDTDTTKTLREREGILWLRN